MERFRRLTTTARLSISTRVSALRFWPLPALRPCGGQSVESLLISIAPIRQALVMIPGDESSRPLVGILSSVGTPQSSSRNFPRGDGRFSRLYASLVRTVFCTSLWRALVAGGGQTIRLTRSDPPGNMHRVCATRLVYAMQLAPTFLRRSPA